MDLADKIIEANGYEHVDKTQGDDAPEGYYTDDMGYWVEQDLQKNRERYAEFILFRCRNLNPGLHTRLNRTTLFNGNERIHPTAQDIIALANTPYSVTTAQAIWVHKQLKSLVPELDRTKVLVAPDIAWDFEKQKLIDLRGKKYITTDGGIWNYD